MLCFYLFFPRANSHEVPTQRPSGDANNRDAPNESPHIGDHPEPRVVADSPGNLWLEYRGEGLCRSPTRWKQFRYHGRDD